MKDKKKVVIKKSVASVAKAASVAKKTESHSSHSIQPIGDRILIKPFLESDVAPKNDFGIIIPETVSKESPERGVVLAVGEGRFHDGKAIPLKVKVGDTVIFSKYGYDEVSADGDKLYILKEESVLAVVTK